MKYYALYNPLSCNGQGEDNAKMLEEYYSGETLCYRNLIEIDDLKKFIDNLEPEDKIILCGGDGTVNRFANDIVEYGIRNEVLYFPIGTGNDFAFDFGLKRGCRPFAINRYIEKLPLVTVNGKTQRFVNGIGYGIDGYCCEVGDKKRLKHAKKINYTSIAVTGLLFFYKPTMATVAVDGEKHTYSHVWLAPVMNGRHYGGGMEPTPGQERNSGKLSVMVFHNPSRLKTLIIFPGIFKGEHILHTESVEILTGSEITVEFDRPTPLQIDGETILGVKEYKASARG